ncbi:MAG: hypothetical protein BWK76_03755 [Desulfobulbaceae bacterium A2]|nr:MAG: hypothetical protein BWK76_03755 [Desulfobulbaceae bacterium A2]
MINAAERTHRQLAWLLLLLGVVVRLLLARNFLLAPEEANVWRFSQELAFGYPEHPPLLIWAIHLCTTLCGTSEMTIRLPTILGLGITGAYLNLLVARWGSWRSACHMQLLLQGLLLSNGLALVATPDGLLLPCWAGAVYHTARSLEQRRDHAAPWLWTGFWFGLGMLSKFTMLLFLPALLLYLGWIKSARRTLARPAPWLGLLLALALVTPLVNWNMHHDWRTLRTFLDNLHLTSDFTWRPLLDFLAAQAALLSPLLLPLIWLSWGSALGSLVSREQRMSYLTWFSFFPFSIILLFSFGSRGHSTWSAPAYFSALVLTALLFAPKPGGRTSWIWLASLLSAWGISVLVIVQALTSILPIPVLLDRTAREITGWDDLARAVRQEVSTMPRPENVFVFSSERYLADELAFYLPGRPDTAFYHPWRIPPDEGYRARGPGILDGDAIGVLTDDRSLERIRRIFTSVEMPRPFEIHRVSTLGRSEVVTTLYLVRAWGFKGEEEK